MLPPILHFHQIYYYLTCLTSENYKLRYLCDPWADFDNLNGHYYIFMHPRPVWHIFRTVRDYGQRSRSISRSNCAYTQQNSTSINIILFKTSKYVLPILLTTFIIRHEAIIFVSVTPWLPPTLQFHTIYRVRTTKCHVTPESIWIILVPIILFPRIPDAFNPIAWHSRVQGQCVYKNSAIRS